MSGRVLHVVALLRDGLRRPAWPAHPDQHSPRSVQLPTGRSSQAASAAPPVTCSEHPGVTTARVQRRPARNDRTPCLCRPAVRCRRPCEAASPPGVWPCGTYGSSGRQQQQQLRRRRRRRSEVDDEKCRGDFRASGGRERKGGVVARGT